jgi:hypothetical protein
MDLSTFSKTTINISNSTKGASSKVGGNILPLSLFQPGDKKQLRALYRLVRNLPELIIYYLRQHVFPSCLNFQATKVYKLLLIILLIIILLLIIIILIIIIIIDNYNNNNNNNNNNNSIIIIIIVTITIIIILFYLF